MELNILYEDEWILVCEKPSGVPSQSDKTFDLDMIKMIKNYLFQKNPQKGEPYVGIVHRLDRPVSGIMVWAKEEIALRRLNSDIRNGKFKKYYYVVSDSKIKGDIDSWIELNDYLSTDTKKNVAIVSKKDSKVGKLSTLRYKLVNVEDYNDQKLALIEVELLTGRHHQIRVQLQNNGIGIWGDTKYNQGFLERNPNVKWVNIALSSYKLSFPHPKTNKLMEFTKVPQQAPFQIFW